MLIGYNDVRRELSVDCFAFFLRLFILDLIWCSRRAKCQTMCQTTPATAATPATTDCFIFIRRAACPSPTPEWGETWNWKHCISSIQPNPIGWNWLDLDWIDLSWIELTWFGLNWLDLDQTGLHWFGSNWNKLNWIKLD